MTWTNWKSPSANAEVSGGGIGSWTDTDNAQVDDDTFASGGAPKTASSKIWRWSAFGFDAGDIPDGATINGVEVRVDCVNGTAVAERSLSLTAQLFDATNGVSTGENQSVPEPRADLTFGGADDLWGNAEISDADVRESTFGVQLQVINDVPLNVEGAFVYFIEVRVDYTAPTGIQFLGSASAGSGNSTPPSVNMGSWGLQEGDFILIISSASSPTAPSGITELPVSGDTNNVFIFYKFMDSAPDTTVSVPADSTTGASVGVLAFRGVNENSPLDVPITLEAGGLEPDPPSITPENDDCAIVAVVCGNGSGGRTFTAGPAGYSGFQAARGNAPFGDSSVGVAYKLLSGGSGVSEDPGAFTYSGNAGARDHYTIALRPAAEGGGGTTATGPLESGAASVSGTAEITGRVAQGSLKSGGAAMSGAAMRSLIAQGVVQAQLASIVAEASRTAKAQGSPKAQDGAVEGSADRLRVLRAQGELETGQAATEGSASAFRVLKAFGSLQAGASKAEGAAERTAKATGALASGPAGIIGAALIFIQGLAVGALRAGAAAIDGTATKTAKAAGALSGGAAAVSGAAERINKAAGALTSGAASVAGVAARAVQAAGTLVSGAAAIVGRMVINIVRPSFGLTARMSDEPVALTATMTDEVALESKMSDEPVALSTTIAP